MSQVKVKLSGGPRGGDIVKASETAVEQNQTITVAGNPDEGPPWTAIPYDPKIESLKNPTQSALMRTYRRVDEDVPTDADR
jgi:hypothetical protein